MQFNPFRIKFLILSLIEKILVFFATVLFTLRIGRKLRKRKIFGEKRKNEKNRGGAGGRKENDLGTENPFKWKAKTEHVPCGGKKVKETMD
jgi:hypothetical protein